MTPSEYTIRHGGGTFDARTLEPVDLPAHGCSAYGPCDGWGESRKYDEHRAYAVAYSDGSAQKVYTDRYANSVLPSAIAGAIANVRARYPLAPYIGTWLADGVCHVDPVVILPDLASARIVGRAFGQIAVWDFAAGESVFVDA